MRPQHWFQNFFVTIFLLNCSDETMQFSTASMTGVKKIWHKSRPWGIIIVHMSDRLKTFICIILYSYYHLQRVSFKLKGKVSYHLKFKINLLILITILIFLREASKCTSFQYDRHTHCYHAWKSYKTRKETWSLKRLKWHFWKEKCKIIVTMTSSF